MKQYTNITHQFGPIYNNDSKILILGSFPSVKSREQQFYYGHAQNRFWKVLSNVLNVPLPNSIDAKKEFLLSHHIALWDVIWQCDIAGSSDATITNVIPNDLSIILQAASIQGIYANGTKAYELYQRHLYPTLQQNIIKLPSTSPANAAWTIDKLTDAWNIILQNLS